MRRAAWLGLAALAAMGSIARAADLDIEPIGEPTITRAVTPPPQPRHRPVPLLDLAYQRFSIGNVDGSGVPLNALHMDFYPISFPWARGGFELEGGRGTASFLGNSAALTYGTVGLRGGVQWPAVVTPFLEGRIATGVLYGRTDGDIAVGESTLPRQSAATWLFTRGLDAGAAIYLDGRVYASLAAGWVRTTWGGGDFSMTIDNVPAAVHIANVTYDSFLFRVGLGI